MDKREVDKIIDVIFNYMIMKDLCNELGYFK